MPLAEAVSTTGENLTPVGSARWIDMKVRLYREHGPCRANLVAEQERVTVTLHAREAGLTCKVADLDRDTRRPPRRVRTRRT